MRLTGRLRLPLAVALGLASPRSAGALGGELLYVDASWLGLVVVGLVALVVWRVPWRLKLALFAVLLGSIALMALAPFPLIPTFLADWAGDSPAALVAFATVIPLLLCGAAFLVLRRLLLGRNSPPRNP